jgi:hypothetical protein
MRGRTQKRRIFPGPKDWGRFLCRPGQERNLDGLLSPIAQDRQRDRLIDAGRPHKVQDDVVEAFHRVAINCRDDIAADVVRSPSTVSGCWLP